MMWFQSAPVTVFLAAMFVCHAVAFGWLSARRPLKRRRYRLLVGTFACLAVLYLLKSAVKVGWLGFLPLSLVLMLRITAAACTLLALFWRPKNSSN